MVIHTKILNKTDLQMEYSNIHIICMYVCMHAYIYIYIYMYVCMYVCVYACCFITKLCPVLY